MTNTSIAFIDIDGVIANNDARFEQATMPDGKIDWTVAFSADLVTLDTLIECVDEHLDALRRAFVVVLFTSRPEHMREATIQWLSDHHVTYDHLVLKPPAAQYVKTIAWKALTLDTVAMLLNAEHVVFVDDEDGNINEVVKHMDVQRYTINTYNDLVSALAEIPL